MQRVLEKMAKQLNAYDEASLMQLWQYYAVRVNEFEPAKKWEEATLALCLIQAVRWKNQLFNYHLALTAVPGKPEDMPPVPEFFKKSRHGDANEGGGEEEKHKATVLRFPGKNQE